MKYLIKTYPICSWLLLCCFFSCKKGQNFNTPLSTDKSKPDVVRNIKVDNYNGGAFITYDLPNSENILYVTASYIINDKTGKTRESKSSYYSDTIAVNGFAEAKEYTVTLKTVSRANVESDPVTVKVNPETPVYKIVAETIQMQADFGGVNVQVTNVTKKPVGVVVLYKNPLIGNYSIYEQRYSDIENVSFSSRGFDTLPKPFGVYITDQWGNLSDTVFKTINPIFEEQLDKSKFFDNKLPSDGRIGFGWEVANLWNNTQDGNGWHTVQEVSNMPITVTIGLGVNAKLSRFVLYGRSGYEFGHGNPRDFSLWGSDKTAPQDAVLPVKAEEGTVVGDWVNMGNYISPPPPSGAPPTAPTAADRAFYNQGQECTVPFDAPRVRFVRIAVNESWSGSTFAHIMELTFFGNTH